MPSKKGKERAVNIDLAPLVAVFVVKFHPHRGNSIEWYSCIASDINLNGVEFSSLPSGSHNIREDVILFKCGKFFGLSAFGRSDGVVSEDRGAKIRAVGILTTTLVRISEHVEFLKSRLRQEPEYWENGSYQDLDDYLDKYKASIDQLKSIPDLTGPETLRQLPSGTLATFVEYFGPHIFLIWKYVMCGKRILFFAPPPVLDLANHVFSTGLLTLRSSDSTLDSETFNPMFYINVNDIAVLNKLKSYVACTTEGIFKTKPQLFDLFLDHGIPVAGGTANIGPAPLPLYSVTDEDNERYKELKKIITSVQLDEPNDPLLEPENSDLVIIQFFSRLNERIFSVLGDVNTAEGLLTNEDIRTMKLNPRRDHDFIKDLIACHDVRLNVEQPEPRLVEISKGCFSGPFAQVVHRLFSCCK